MRIWFIHAALSCFLLASSAWADTIHLNNGDRISGSIVLLDGGRLLIKTPYAGTLSLDLKQVASLDSDQQFIAKQQQADDSRLVRLHSSQPGMIRLVEDGRDTELRIRNIHQLLPHEPKQLVSDLLWKGSLQLAADYKRKEVDSDSYDLRFDGQLRHGRWRHGFEAGYEHETKDDSKKTDRLTAGYGLDYFMTQRWFWKGKGKYTHDKLEDVRRKAMLGTGPGFQFWDNAIGSLSASTLLAHNRYSFASGERESFYSLVPTWNYQRYFLAKTLELYYQGKAGLPFTPAIQYTLDSQIGLRYKINSWASFNVRSEWEKIKSQQGDLNDRRYLMGVGINW